MGEPLAASSKIRHMSGAHKAAALLLAMESEAAAKILKHFDANELRLITRSTADLGSVPTQDVETLIEDFTEGFASGFELLGSAGKARQLMAGILSPEQIADIMSDVLGGSNSLFWEKLSSVPEVTIADYLIKEHPQTAALVLSRIPPSVAAKVIGIVPKNIRNALMRRMLSIKPASDPAMHILESVLQDDLLHNVARKTSADANARVADIINKLDREQVEDVLQNIATDKPKVAATLRSLLFTFDDISKLSPRARAVLFDQVPSDRTVMALKNAEPAFRDMVLSSLAARSRRLVEHELNTSGAAPPKDIAKARRMIADLVLELAGKGVIEINENDEDAS